MKGGGKEIEPTWIVREWLIIQQTPVEPAFHKARIPCVINFYIACFMLYSQKVQCKTFAHRLGPSLKSKQD